MRKPILTPSRTVTWTSFSSITESLRGGGLSRAFAHPRPLLEPRFVVAIDDEAEHGTESEGDGGPHIELLHRQADESGAEKRADDRADAADAELPARAVGAQRGRIDERARNVDAGLNAEHEEAREERGDHQRGLRADAEPADRSNDRHGEDEEDGDGEESPPIDPAAEQQRAERAADLQHGAGQRAGR